MFIRSFIQLKVDLLGTIWTQLNAVELLETKVWMLGTPMKQMSAVCKSCRIWPRVDVSAVMTFYTALCHLCHELILSPVISHTAQRWWFCLNTTYITFLLKWWFVGHLNRTLATTFTLGSSHLSLSCWTQRPHPNLCWAHAGIVRGCARLLLTCCTRDQHTIGELA